MAALAFVETLHLSFEVLAPTLGLAQGLGQEQGPAGDAANVAFQVTVLFRLLVAIGGLVLVHNLYAGAAQQARLVLRWPALALSTFWGFDLNLHTIAYLGGAWPVELASLRGIAIVAVSSLLVLGAVRGREQLRFRPSRTVAFQTFSLLVIGGYLAAMVAIAKWLTYAGGDFARLMAMAFLAAGFAAILVLPSSRMRGWMKVTLAKHLFQHRYDYRAEWLRFTRTIGQAGAAALPLEERVVQAVADIADAPAGLLLAAGDQGELTLAARWQWPSAEVPATAMDGPAISFFERTGLIVDLDDLRASRDLMGEAEVVPDWLIEESRAWALVPLIHYERLTGVVVLARPLLVRKFDWEDFDLLRVAGQQLASYLAEHAGQTALAEANRFDDFHRRIAFVMHDIKNLASQLSLLARNAELHADKPDFRADMLVTLRNSADKLNGLLARLSRYGGGAVDRLVEVDAAEILRQVAEQFRGRHAVILTECHDCRVSANRDSLEQVIVHLVQNAIDASPAIRRCSSAWRSMACMRGSRCSISGSGMSAEFVRSKLFKPFVSSKPGGFGIGAFEARELVRAMRGRVEVESREGLGSRFIVRLPLSAATGILQSLEQSSQKVA